MSYSLITSIMICFVNSKFILNNARFIVNLFYGYSKIITLAKNVVIIKLTFFSKGH